MIDFMLSFVGSSMPHHQGWDQTPDSSTFAFRIFLYMSLTVQHTQLLASLVSLSFHIYLSYLLMINTQLLASLPWFYLASLVLFFFYISIIYLLIYHNYNITSFCLRLAFLTS
jgi:hypothetical protein